MRPRSSLVLALLVAACSKTEPPEGPRVAAPYAGPPQRSAAERCAGCHASHVEDWSRTAMARSLEPTRAAELEGLGPVTDAAGYTYAFQTDGGAGERAVLVESRADRPEHALGAEVLFGIGSGTRDRSYALAHGATVRFSPVEVLPVPGGRRAALAPHAAMHPGSRFASPITAECLGCHTESLPRPNFPLDLRDPEWTPRGLSCAACHGESEAHADWQEADEAGTAVGADPLVMHGELGRWQRLSVCAACHLQGDARLVLNPGELGPPLPGGDLLEQRALFVAKSPTNEVGFVSQVERLALSRCFTESKMTCETCHDPHRSLQESAERRRVRAACTSCHAPDEEVAMPFGGAPTASRCSRPQDTTIETHSVQRELTARRDCVTCHMPRTGVFDVAEVTIHDHFVRRDGSDARPPTPEDELRFPESPTGDWVRFAWPGVPAPAHLEDPGLWLMAYASGGHLERAGELVDAAPGPVARRLPMYHHLRGGRLAALGRRDEAIASYQRGLELSPSGELTPDQAPSATNLATLLVEAGRAPEALALLDRLIARFPQAEGALRNRAVQRAGAGDLAGARADLERAFGVLPSAAVAASLAQLARGLGDAAGAERWRAAARALDPLRDPAAR